MWCSTSSGSLCMVRHFSPPGVLRLMSFDVSASSSIIWAYTTAGLSSGRPCLFRHQCIPRNGGLPWLLTVFHGFSFMKRAREFLNLRVSFCSLYFLWTSSIISTILLCFHIAFNVAHLKTRRVEGVIYVSSHTPSSLTIITLAWTAQRSPVHTDEGTQSARRPALLPLSAVL